jgi:hypothetical protein
VGGVPDVTAWAGERRATASVVEPHDFVEVRLEHDGYVALCSCGWRSEPRTHGWAAGNDWKSHR